MSRNREDWPGNSWIRLLEVSQLSFLFLLYSGVSELSLFGLVWFVVEWMGAWWSRRALEEKTNLPRA